MLAELAVNEPATFASLVATAKAALPATSTRPRPRSHGIRFDKGVLLTEGALSRAPGAHPAGTPRPYAEPVLENPRSPRVRAVAKLTKRSARQETGLFLLEGPQAAREALAYRPETVIEVFATPTAMERHADLRDAARDAGVEVVFTTEARARRDGRHRDAAGDRRGRAAVADLRPRRVRRIAPPGRDLRGGARSGQPRHDHPGRGCRGRRRRDPHRPHGRSVQPQGRPRHDGVALPPAGRGRRGPRERRRARARGGRARRRRRCRAAGTSSRARSLLAEPTAWLFGNEARGLDEESLALADLSLRLPIYGSAESLNLATAASVCLYETAFAQRAGAPS